MRHNIIFQQILSCKYFFFIFFFYFFLEILNLTLVQPHYYYIFFSCSSKKFTILNNLYVSSPLDIYECFVISHFPQFTHCHFNSRSVFNKSAVINNYITENKIDILCILKISIHEVVSLKIHISLHYFHPIMFCRSIMADLIRPVKMLLL